MQYLVVLFKTIFYYVTINIIYRILGKREIGELSVMDLIITFLLTELAAMNIDRYKDSIFIALIPMIILVVIEIITSKLIFKNSRVRNFLEGHPSIIINRGKINFSEMLKCRYNISDLLIELRKQGIKSIEEVSYAILETNGNLSIFTKNGKLYGDFPMPIILDGEIQNITLNEIDKDEKWIRKVLNNKKIKLEDVFYAFYNNGKLYVIKSEM